MKKKSKWNLSGYLTGKYAVFALFVVYAVTLLIPFLWMILNAFKTKADFNAGNIWGWPAPFYGKNFLDILKYRIEGQSILEMLLLSILITVLGTVINVFFSASAAYVMSKYRFKGKKLLFSLAIFSMVVPIVGTLPAQINFMKMIGLDDSLVGVLYLYSGCFGFNFILLYSSFESISWTYAEAAEMDGAGHFRVFFQVMLPMCRGPLISCAILQAIALWNDYSTPRIFMQSRMTLAVGLQALQSELGGSANYTGVFASMIIAIVPILVLYSCFQKKIIENTVAGGLKG